MIKMAKKAAVKKNEVELTRSASREDHARQFNTFAVALLHGGGDQIPRTRPSSVNNDIARCEIDASG